MSTQAKTFDDEMQQAKLELGDYSEFYSHLAIQARRASRVALLACSVALVALISAILAQLKPPILLRVQDGKVSSLDGSGVEAAETARQHVVRQRLRRRRPVLSGSSSILIIVWRQVDGWCSASRLPDIAPLC